MNRRTRHDLGWIIPPLAIVTTVTLLYAPLRLTQARYFAGPRSAGAASQVNAVCTDGTATTGQVEPSSPTLASMGSGLDEPVAIPRMVWHVPGGDLVLLASGD